MIHAHSGVTIRLPSTDGHGEHDRYVQLPVGTDRFKAINAINDIIHMANLEDSQDGGICLDGNTVEENIQRRIAELGFAYIRQLDSTNCWDHFDPGYVLVEALVGSSAALPQQPAGPYADDPAEQVMLQCGDDVWGECKQFPKRSWINEVQEGNTPSGYWDWVVSEAEARDVPLESLTGSVQNDSERPGSSN